MLKWLPVSFGRSNNYFHMAGTFSGLVLHILGRCLHDSLPCCWACGQQRASACSICLQQDTLSCSRQTALAQFLPGSGVLEHAENTRSIEIDALASSQSITLEDWASVFFLAHTIVVCFVLLFFPGTFFWYRKILIANVSPALQICRMGYIFYIPRMQFAVPYITYPCSSRGSQCFVRFFQGAYKSYESYSRIQTELACIIGLVVPRILFMPSHVLSLCYLASTIFR